MTMLSAIFLISSHLSLLRFLFISQSIPPLLAIPSILPFSPVLYPHLHCFPSSSTTPLLFLSSHSSTPFFPMSSSLLPLLFFISSPLNSSSPSLASLLHLPPLLLSSPPPNTYTFLLYSQIMHQLTEEVDSKNKEKNKHRGQDKTMITKWR